MKTQKTSSRSASGMLVAIATLMLLMINISGPLPATGNPNPKVIPNKGHKYERLSVRWWKWAFSYPAADIPFFNAGGPVDLADGRSLVVPLARYTRLVQGSPAERHHWQLLGDGYAIEWPDLDEHIGIEGLLAGRRSGESAQSFARWMASRRTPAE